VEQISVTDAAKRKACSRQAVVDAIKAKKLDAVRIGNMFVILVTDRFEQWTPNPKLQKSGKRRWASASKKVRR